MSATITISPPVRLGDEVWIIRSFGGRKHVVNGVVTALWLENGEGDRMRLGVTVKGRGRGEWGVTVFAAFDEAQAALGRMVRA